jgi:hypothetical protein
MSVRRLASFRIQDLCVDAFWVGLGGKKKKGGLSESNQRFLSSLLAHRIFTASSTQKRGLTPKSRMTTASALHYAGEYLTV